MSEIKDKEPWHGHTNAEVENYIKNRLDNSAGYRKILYAELKELRDNGKLIPGMQYRITDYECTTTTAGTTSAGHAFDVIVTADDESTLNEVARAIKHEDDTYFADCDLNAWQIWYCLDNDTNMFAWADSTNGKGVIYRMIDEFSNDAPYDFKNIQFYRKWSSSKSLWSIKSSDSTGVPCYTFSSEGTSSTTSFTDMSLVASNRVYSNVIKEFIGSNKQTLNNNCFFGTGCDNNSFGNSCYSNTFGSNCYSNSFGISCYSNTFGNNCHSNTFGNYCHENTFGIDCHENIFGIDCNFNTFGNSCLDNTFGISCSYNSFGISCYTNTFGNYCKSNTFGNYCKSNSFENDCQNNSFRVSADKASALKSYVYYNHFDDGCSYNVIWNSDTTSIRVLLKNININRGVVGTIRSYNMININVLNQDYEVQVAKNSNGELKIYCEADLI